MSNLYDELTIEAAFKLSNDDFEALTFLYQPIVGGLAIALYQSLYYEAINRQERIVKILNKEISDIMGESILNVEKLRCKLEGVGLVQTYEKNEELLIILRKPLQPNRFLNETVLGVTLRNTVGDDLTKQIASKFNFEKVDLTGFNEITKCFTETFEIKKIDSSVRKPRVGKIKSGFDYDDLIKKLKNVEDIEFTNSFRNKVIDLADNYCFTTSDMKKVILDSYKNRKFDISLMNEAARKYYNLKNNSQISIEANKDLNIRVDSEGKELIKNLLVKYFKFASSDMVKIMIEAKEKTGLNNDQIEEMIKEIYDNCDGVFPNAKYVEKISTTYVQKGSRKRPRKTKDDVFDEYERSMEDEPVWKS